LIELRKMRPLISKMTAALLLLGAFGSAAPAGAARQTPASKTVAKPSTAKKVSARTRSASRRKARQRAQTVPTPKRISDIQSALAAQGAYKGQPNGKWDNTAVQAMKDYQSSHGLTPTGKLDALTLQRLGLGSEIAGRAAPLPSPQPQGAAASRELQQTP
jgi:peptidoglycan hydrolase-like protein with peptidoglycan-binding domain